MSIAFHRVLWTGVATALLCASGQWNVTVTEGARILAVETVGGKSHWNFMSAVIRALVDRGHDVVAFTPFPDGGGGGGGDRSRGNYTEVDVSDAVPKILDANLDDMKRDWGSAIGIVRPLMAMSRQACDAIYGKPEMRRLLRRGDEHVAATRSTDDIDVVLVEPLLSDCVSYAAGRLRSPLIYVMPLSDAGGFLRPSTGHFSNPAVSSHVMADHGLPATFAQRLTNAAMHAYWQIGGAFWDAALRHAEPKEFDSAEPVPPSVVFVNGHFASNAATSVPANVFNVGGVHLRPARGLPQDILDFIEQSPHGVICFTLGSTVKISSLPEHLKKAIIEALAQLPQRVLLKYEDDMKEKPKNVMTLKWLPQRDILVHPNVKLFISHGGISGLYEAVDAGVPVLGFPLFADQYRNIDSLVNVGMAISMELFTVTKDVFLNNVLEMLDNEKYANNAKTASEIFKDRPLSPAELVVYWTEYVIRHKGAPHLKSHALKLTWYQYYLLDVIAVVLIFISVIVFVFYKILKTIYRHSIKLRQNVKTKSQ